jgi:hypothetical protein
MESNVSVYKFCFGVDVTSLTGISVPTVPNVPPVWLTNVGVPPIKLWIVGAVVVKASDARRWPNQDLPVTSSFFCSTATEGLFS